MYILNVEKRNESLKAKQLRRAGIVPVSVYGGGLPETLQVQVPLVTAGKMLKTKSKGAQIMLDFEGKKLRALLKEVNYEAISGNVESLSFQKLLDDEMVTSAVKIIVINKDKTLLRVQQVLDEIPYRALPPDLVEKIEIDIDDMKGEHNVKVSDLPFAKNEKIEILIATDAMVLNLVDNYALQEVPTES